MVRRSMLAARNARDAMFEREMRISLATQDQTSSAMVSQYDVYKQRFQNRYTTI